MNACRVLSALMLFTGSFCFLGVDSVSADTVFLKNGSRLHGKAVDQRAQGGPVRLEIGDSGHLILSAAQIAKIEKNDRRTPEELPEIAIVPAAFDEAVVVTLKTGVGNDFYGPGPYFGWRLSQPGDQELVLRLPGGGVLRVPQSAVENVQKAAAAGSTELKGVEPSATVIRTTHVVHLKNKRVLRGTIETTPENEPLKLRIGNMGLIMVDRDDVEKIEAVESAYKLPETPETPAAETTPPPAKSREELKRELRREIMRDILQELIDEKIDESVKSALEQGRGLPAGLERIARSLRSEEILEIQELVRELGRQRNTNRVRAENALKGRGVAALPFLEPAAHHPFSLTRRAVQRIIGAIGDLRGAPMAIDALTDDDVFVRRLAHDALKRLLPGSIAFDAEAPASRLRAAQKRYRTLWDDLRRTDLEKRLEEELREPLISGR